MDELDSGVPSNELDSLMNDDNYNVYTKMWPNRTYVCFNAHEGLFADVNVRQAIVYGLNRDEIFEKGFKGIGMKAEYFISPMFEWALDKDTKIQEYDVEKANQMLDEAGLTKNADGIRFETSIDTFGIRFTAPARVTLAGRTISVPEALFLGTPDLYEGDDILRVGQYGSEAGDLVGETLRVTGYFFRNSETEELSRIEGSEVYSYRPNGDYVFQVLSWERLG